jgi:hypothetical protein
MEVIKVEGGELENRKEEMPKKKESPLATYIFVIIILTIGLALTAPTQLQQFVHASYTAFASLSEFGQVLVVLIVLVALVYVLRRMGIL